MKQLVMPVLVMVPLTVGVLWLTTGSQNRPEAGTAVAAEPSGPFIAPMDCSDPLACVVQNHVDLDPGPATVDPACGARSYNDHQGVDFRILDLPTMLEGVPVRAVADGEVLGTRDGEYDGAWLAKGREAVGNRDCGNGISIRHEDGYVTQLCHLRRNSVSVKKGDIVTQGQVVGAVGMSGRAEFPHVHLSIRKGEQRIDPFTGSVIGDACGTQGKSLWAGPVPDHWQPEAGPFIFKSGFTSAPVTLAMIERAPADPTVASKAMVFYARAVGLKAGDVEKIELTGPDGFTPVGSTGEPLERDKAQIMRFVGRPAKDDPLPAGEYHGRYQILRDGEPVLDISRYFTIGG
jgi:murein DD-endopeptidase MepM/ murein hydrolase activator NlpD